MRMIGRLTMCYTIGLLVGCADGTSPDRPMPSLSRRAPTITVVDLGLTGYARQSRGRPRDQLGRSGGGARISGGIVSASD